jgi:hypothetical protein
MTDKNEAVKIGGGNLVRIFHLLGFTPSSLAPIYRRLPALLLALMLRVLFVPPLQEDRLL